MTLLIKKFVRKHFEIEAIQITAENMIEAAEWCSGTIKSDGPNSYIKVHVQRPLNGRQTKAFVNDWILYAGRGFKVYTDKTFHNSFEKEMRDE